MAITLTLTATNPTPAEASLPVNVALTAVAVDSNDPSAVFAYSWHILDKPPASAAALDDRRNQNPNLQDIDVWGSYRLFCIAQNTSSGDTSEQDPLAATADSFLDIEVLSENRTLVKPAKSQRNWHTRYWELVDVVEHLEAGQREATFVIDGSLEVATAAEIAGVYGPGDSSSGTAFLAVTTEQLNTALVSNDAGGTLGVGSTNILRDNVKNAALEKMNEVSITEMADVDTTTIAPQAGQALIWSPTHTDDSGDGDTGAWVPGDVTGSSNLFGAGLCAGEELNTGDFLIYREDCQEVPVAGAIPGWHARNRYNGEGFALNFPFASPGRATAAYMAAAEAASLGTWDDNREAVGQVAIASVYNTARARGYDADVFTTGSQITAALNVGQLPAFAMSPLNFAQSLIGQSFVGPNGTINNVVVDTNKDGESIALYDPGYHTAAEIADLVADANAGTTFDGVAINLIQQALSTHHLLRLGRSSITRLLDVDTTTHAPVDNDFLVWDSAHADDGGQGTGAWVPKSAAELGLGSGGGVTGLTSNETDEVSLDSGFTFLPSVDNTLDLGNTSQRFRRVYSNEVIGDTTSTDGLYTKLSLNAEIPGSAAAGLRAAALYSRGSIAMMVDTNNTGNADTNAFYVYEGAEDDATATERFRVENDGTVRINNAYNLPTADSSANRVMATNGAGQVSFVTIDSIYTPPTQTQQILHTFDAQINGTFTDEITYNASGYTAGLGRSPLMFMFKNPYDQSIALKDFSLTCGHMHSSTIQFSFVKFDRSLLLQNIYTTISAQYTMSKTNINTNVNNEGIGNVENAIGVSIAAGEYFGVLLNGYEKTGQDNERWHLTVEALG